MASISIQFAILANPLHTHRNVCPAPEMTVYATDAFNMRSMTPNAHGAVYPNKSKFNVYSDALEQEAKRAKRAKNTSLLSRMKRTRTPSPSAMPDVSESEYCDFGYYDLEVDAEAIRDSMIALSVEEQLNYEDEKFRSVVNPVRSSCSGALMASKRLKPHKPLEDGSVLSTNHSDSPGELWPKTHGEQPYWAPGRPYSAFHHPVWTLPRPSSSNP